MIFYKMKAEKKFLKTFENNLKTDIREYTQEIKNEILALKSRSRSCGVPDCPRRDLILYYCKHCKKNQTVCRKDFRGRTVSQVCPVCSTRSITRRFGLELY